MLPDPDDRQRLAAWTIWCDGVFELALGLKLATSPLTGLLGRLMLPAPATPTLVTSFGLLLLPVGLGLLALSRRRTRVAVLALVGANAGGAVVLAGWLLLRWPAFGTAGQILTALTTAVLIILAVLELAGLRREVGAAAAPA